MTAEYSLNFKMGQKYHHLTKILIIINGKNINYLKLAILVGLKF